MTGPGSEGTPGGSGNHLLPNKTRLRQSCNAFVPKDLVTPRRSRVLWASSVTARWSTFGWAVTMIARSTPSAAGKLAGAQAEVDELGDVRVVVAHVRAALAQQADDLQRR